MKEDQSIALRLHAEPAPVPPVPLKHRLRNGVVWLMIQLLVVPPLALWHPTTYAADCPTSDSTAQPSNVPGPVDGDEGKNDEQLDLPSNFDADAISSQGAAVEPADHPLDEPTALPEFPEAALTTLGDGGGAWGTPGGADGQGGDLVSNAIEERKVSSWPSLCENPLTLRLTDP